MASIAFRTNGTLCKADERAALLLSPHGSRHTLRLGYVLRGTEEAILPETLLDDWGHEISGLDLYKWVWENALHFPRAELFGVDLAGRLRQCFIRDLDLSARYPCYVFADPSKAALAAGIQLTEILVPSAHVGLLRQERAPETISFPLSVAEVGWWLVNEVAALRPDYDFYEALEENGSR
jgi:hypothetical protein